MRLWSLHPGLLDRQGLTAVWREALLAQAVLAERTKGYRRHPQLERFRAQPDPLAAVGAYLRAVAEEASNRGYSFDRSRIDVPAGISRAEAGGREGAGAEVRDGRGSSAEAEDDRGADVTVGSGRNAGAEAGEGRGAGAVVPDGRGSDLEVPLIPVTEGQVAYEWRHLLAKLRRRSPERLADLDADSAPPTHPLFTVVPGPTASWERPD